MTTEEKIRILSNAVSDLLTIGDTDTAVDETVVLRALRHLRDDIHAKKTAQEEMVLDTLIGELIVTEPVRVETPIEYEDMPKRNQTKITPGVVKCPNCNVPAQQLVNQMRTNPAYSRYVEQRKLSLIDSRLDYVDDLLRMGVLQ